MMNKCYTFLLTLLIFLIYVEKGQAAARQVWKLEFKEHPEISAGETCILKRVTPKEGDHFLIDQITVSQPIQVSLVTEKSEDDLSLELYKHDWKNLVQSGSTQGKGVCTLQFRTQGEVNVRVVSEEGKEIPYELLAWVGPKLESSMSSPFVSMAEYKKQQAKKTSGDKILYLLLSLGIFVLIIIAFLLFMNMKKNSGKMVGLVFFFFTFFFIFEASAGLGEIIKDVGKVAESMTKGMKIGEAGGKFAALTPEDSKYEPNYPEGPQLPSQCIEDPDCRACFNRAYANLEVIRKSLELLRVNGVYTNDYVKRALAFGDSVSGVHGVAGLAWQAEKIKIEKSFDDFKKTYDKKYKELIAALKRALEDIGTCEKEHMDNADWYRTYGSLYYMFMEDVYRRKF